MTTKQQINTYPDIDWELLWQQARAEKSWKSKGAREWDSKAAAFSARTKTSPYVDKFLAHLDLKETMNVLDVGCGPGTLALPIAQRVALVTALDYSQGMLDCLREQADSLDLTNIRTVHCAWDDDWRQHHIGTTYDIVIASRSMNIEKPLTGLRKLIDHCRKTTGQIFIAERIEPSPFDPDAFEAIGRPFASGPDYIYTLNMLYTLGIHPEISHIELERELRFSDLDHALQSYAWMFKELSDGEEQRLRQFLRSRISEQQSDCIVIQRKHPQRWALLHWTNV
jgi:SAM-dependent methyltransferase